MAATTTTATTAAAAPVSPKGDDEAAWIRIQRKTFSRWVNAHLAERNLTFEEGPRGLEDGLADGLRLFALLEIVSSEVLSPRPHQRPKLKLHCIENLGTSLAFIKYKKIVLVGIGAEDIYDKKSKLVLGLVWTLILRFQVQKARKAEAQADNSKEVEVADSGARNELLEWVNKVLAPQGLHVDNFARDWQDGRAFSGLVNVLEPDTIANAKDLPAGGNDDKSKNLDRAFDEATKRFKFPRLLDANDLLEHADELSVMTYVSYFREYLATQRAAALMRAKLALLDAGRVKAGEEAVFVVKGSRKQHVNATLGMGKEFVTVEIKSKGDNSEGRFTPTKVGTYTLTVTYGEGDELKTPDGAPAQVEVIAADWDPSKSSASGEDLSANRAGREGTFQVTIVPEDRFGNRVEVGPLAVVGTGVGATKAKLNVDRIQPAAGSTPAALIYDVHYTGINEAARFQLAITAGGIAIPGSPYELNIGLGSSRLVLSKPRVVAGDKETVLVENGARAPLTARLVPQFYSSEAEKNKNAVAIELQPPTGNDVRGTFTLTKAGQYQLLARFDDGEVPIGCPAAVECIHAELDISKAKASGDHLKTCPADQAGQFLLEVVPEDRFGNPIADIGIISVAIASTGKTVAARTRRMTAKGSRTPRSGADEPPLSARGAKKGSQVATSGSAVSTTTTTTTSSTAVKTTSSEDHHKSSGSRTSRSHKKNEEVQRAMKDAAAIAAETSTSPRGGGAVSPRSADGTPASESTHVHTSVTVNKNNKHDVNYVAAEVAGTYLVDIRIGNRPIPSSPFDLLITPGKAAAKKCKVSGDALKSNRVSQTSHLTVQLCDKYGNPLTRGGDDVTAHLQSLEDPESSMDVDIKDAGDGSYGLSFTPDFCGRASLTIKARGHNVRGSPFVIDIDEDDDSDDGGGETANVELFMNCEQLPREVVRQGVRVVVYMRKGKGGAWKRLGQTEKYRNDRNPNFCVSVPVHYSFEKAQQLRFSVCSAKGDPADPEGGLFVVPVGNILIAKDGCLTSKLASPTQRPVEGTITVRAVENREMRMLSRFTVQVRGLDAKKPPSTYVKVLKLKPGNPASTKDEEEEWEEVRRLETVKDNASPNFAPFCIRVGKLNDGDFDRPLKLELYQKKTLLGSSQATFRDLQRGREWNYQLRDPKKRNKKTGEEGPAVGELNVNVELVPEPSFLDYLSTGYNVRLMCAIDFTASNGDPEKPGSLHAPDPNNPNPYAQAIMAVGDVLVQYDPERLVLGYGFGARNVHGSTSVNQCFPINLRNDDPQCQGVEGMLAAYYETLKRVKLYGPSCFDKILRAALEYARKIFAESKTYLMLLLMTDGLIEDLKESVKSVVKASNEPLSIIMVGVGDAEFRRMNILEATSERQRAKNTNTERDVLQFFAFKELKEMGADALNEALLSRIPEQFVGHMFNHAVLPKTRPKFVPTPTVRNLTRPEDMPRRDDSSSDEE